MWWDRIHWHVKRWTRCLEGKFNCVDDIRCVESYDIDGCAGVDVLNSENAAMSLFMVVLFWKSPCVAWGWWILLGKAQWWVIFLCFGLVRFKVGRYNVCWRALYASPLLMARQRNAICFSDKPLFFWKVRVQTCKREKAVRKRQYKRTTLWLMKQLCSYMKVSKSSWQLQDSRLKHENLSWLKITREVEVRFQITRVPVHASRKVVPAIHLFQTTRQDPYMRTT